jgi:hypothetical protein
MTEPDEALIWAREDYARQRPKREAELIRDGAFDALPPVDVRAHAYRAGQRSAAFRAALADRDPEEVAASIAWLESTDPCD